MTINDAKKVMLDKVNLDMEAAQLQQDILVKEKQIKKLNQEVEDAAYSYSELENSGVKQFFLGLTGKKEERLQEAQNEVRRTRGELASAEFELTSLKAKVEEIEQTRNEIESVCNECVSLIAEIDGEEIKNRILAISVVLRMGVAITNCLSEMKPLFTIAYDIYETQTGRPTTPGTYINKDSEMRKHSRVIENGVNKIIKLLNTYNQYAPEEIKIEFHDKWMDKDNYWEEQQMAYDTMERIKKVEDWFYRLDNCWKAMGKQKKETMQRLQEEVFAYLDE